MEVFEGAVPRPEVVSVGVGEGVDDYGGVVGRGWEKGHLEGCSVGGFCGCGKSGPEESEDGVEIESMHSCYYEAGGYCMI